MNKTINPAQVNSKTFWSKYTESFTEALSNIKASDQENEISYDAALDLTMKWLVKAQQAHRKIMIIGNGGSAGVASHLAVDFWKNGGVRAITFNDAPVLTCIANDYSYDEVFSIPIEQFAEKGDIAICISSSGSSVNILKGAQAALQSGATVITCSGFKPDNTLRSLGHLNFYVPSFSYGFVETLHQFIIHSILDVKMFCVDEKDIFHKNQPMK
ncbi:MAG: SIS domain-containing protein [Bacteroidia bacterium]